MTNELKPASPLPWWIDADRPDIGGFIAKAADDTTVLYSRVLPCAANASYVEKTHQNYRFIVAACNAYPGLVARIAALEAENAKMREAVFHGVGHLEAAATVSDDKVFVKWARQLASELRAKMETADV